MGIFNTNENRIRCGKCNTEFDLNKNDGCPMCKFGSGKGQSSPKTNEKVVQPKSSINYLAVPSNLKLKDGKPIIDSETSKVGSWGMFNSLFSGKAILRITSNMMYEKGSEHLTLAEVVDTASNVFELNGLSKLRGFPNDPRSDSSLGRLVYHFIKTFNRMGLLEIKSKTANKSDVWIEEWNNILITPTKQGLEFARLRNRIFDDQDSTQILTVEEKEWLVQYLKKLDKEGYKEYTLLNEVLNFIKDGHNGKNELCGWFVKNKNFREYVKEWSRKSENDNEFEEQIKNLAITFSASKIALLRELCTIKNKRNDYGVIGGL